MEDFSPEQDTVTEDQQAQAEAANTEAKQKSRIQTMIEQKKKQATEVAKTVVKKQVKSAMRRIVIDALIAIFADPWTYIILAAVLIIVLGYMCAEDITGCVDLLGMEGVIEMIDITS